MAVNGGYSFWISEQDILIKGANTRQKSVRSCAFFKMFRLLPFVAASCYRLVPLPVEIWSTILRNLDPLSLLSTARADTVLLDICRGDTILKKMLREGMKMEKKAAFDVMMDPRLAVSTSRIGDRKAIFSQNVVKTVTHKKTTTPSQSMQIIRRKNIVPPASLHQDISNKQNRKYSPYRL
ncbi:hypothetical protein JTB14_017104 [Gonioctena quinquepunctata]|nr:hypothetical protein JTB14_017104 [Gonioctena quinquepunctata]